LLLARLKPGVTGKYRTTRKDGNKSDAFVCELLVTNNLDNVILKFLVLVA